MALYLKFYSILIMTLKTKILFATFFHLSLGATDICSTHTPCKCVLDSSRTIDLTSIGLLIYPRFDEIIFDNGFYSYNPCHPFDSSSGHTTLEKGNKPCIKSAACVKHPGGNEGQLPEEHSIGLQETAKFGQDDQESYHINYTVSSANQSLTVNLICNKTIDYHHLEIIKPESASNFHVVMNLTSKCACINGCSSDPPSDGDSGGLSTGSQLLIVFFTLLLAYLLVGILWNAFNGAKGSELIPNVEFWNELPKLILEGVLFTCSCFGRKSSYGEV